MRDRLFSLALVARALSSKKEARSPQAAEGVPLKGTFFVSDTLEALYGGDELSTGASQAPLS